MMDDTMDVRIARIEEKLTASDKALEIAKEGIERRLEGMNQLRDQINSERGAFVTRLEYSGKHEILSNAISDLQKYQYMAMGGLLVFQVVVALILHFTAK